MSRLRYNRRQAVAHLHAQCPRMSAFIDVQGALKIRCIADGDQFQALARSIVYQQLSGKAAATIHSRFEALFCDEPVCPEGALGLSHESLRGAGLSNNKALSIHDLAAKCCSGELPSHRRLVRMGDAEVIEALCHVRGIGPWTAQMHLMFVMGRPDVMPATDLGVQKGVQNVYRLTELPSPDQVTNTTRHLAPFRSAASWYFWRAADVVTLD